MPPRLQSNDSLLLGDVAGVHQALSLLAEALQLHKTAEFQHIADAPPMHTVHLWLLRHWCWWGLVARGIGFWTAAPSVPAIKLLRISSRSTVARATLQYGNATNSPQRQLTSIRSR